MLKHLQKCSVTFLQMFYLTCNHGLKQTDCMKEVNAKAGNNVAKVTVPDVITENLSALQVSQLQFRCSLQHRNVIRTVPCCYVVCLMFRTSSITILSTFKVVMIINLGLQTVHLLLTVILNLRYLDNESLLCLLVLDALHLT